MRSFSIKILVLLTILALNSPPAQSQENGTPTTKTTPSLIALDRPSADLLRLHFPAAKIAVLVSSDDQSFDILNQQAHLLRDKSHIFFRGDRCSLVSHFFLERLSNQGVRSLEITEFFGLQKRTQPKNVDSNRYRIALEKREKNTMALLLTSTR